MPDDLEVTITPPSGVAKPTVSQTIGAEIHSNDDAHRPVRVAHIARAGDYNITTNGKVTSYASPRLSFGQTGRFWFLSWLFGGLFGGLFAVITVVGLIWLFKWARGLRDPAFTGAPVQGTGQVHSVQRISRPFWLLENGRFPVQCQIALHVQLPGREPYDATTSLLVDPSAMPNLQPGATVVVTADSENPQNVRIDLTQPIRPGPARPAELA